MGRKRRVPFPLLCSVKSHVLLLASNLSNTVYVFHVARVSLCFSLYEVKKKPCHWCLTSSNTTAGLFIRTKCTYVHMTRHKWPNLGSMQTYFRIVSRSPDTSVCPTTPRLLTGIMKPKQLPPAV